MGCSLLVQMIYIHYIATNLLTSEPFIALKNRRFCLRSLSDTANEKKPRSPIMIAEVNMSVPYTRRKLFYEKNKLALSALGVASALVLRNEN